MLTNEPILRRVAFLGKQSPGELIFSEQIARLCSRWWRDDESAAMLPVEALEGAAQAMCENLVEDGLLAPAGDGKRFTLTEEGKNALQKRFFGRLRGLSSRKSGTNA